VYNSIFSIVTAKIQIGTEFVNTLLGLSVNSVTQSVTPAVTATIQSIQQTSQTFSSQTAGIVDQTKLCIQQAVSDATTAAGTTAAGTTAAAPTTAGTTVV
jgi:hypothetical protein